MSFDFTPGNAYFQFGIPAYGKNTTGGYTWRGSAGWEGESYDDDDSTSVSLGAGSADAGARFDHDGTYRTFSHSSSEAVDEPTENGTWRRTTVRMITAALSPI